MRITEIAVTYGGKLNLGNYESAEITCHIAAELAPDDDAQAVEAELWSRAKASVREQARPLVEARKEGINAVFVGLPADVAQKLKG